MRIEISNVTHGSLQWDLPDDLAKKVARLSAQQQEIFKRGITQMLNEYFLFVTTALGSENPADELEKVWQMQRLLMSEFLKGGIVFIPKDELGGPQ